MKNNKYDFIKELINHWDEYQDAIKKYMEASGEEPLTSSWLKSAKFKKLEGSDVGLLEITTARGKEITLPLFPAELFNIMKNFGGAGTILWDTYWFYKRVNKTPLQESQGEKTFGNYLLGYVEDKKHFGPCDFGKRKEEILNDYIKLKDVLDKIKKEQSIDKKISITQKFKLKTNTLKFRIIVREQTDVRQKTQLFLPRLKKPKKQKKNRHKKFRTGNYAIKKRKRRR
jgi:hypothetical protein